MAMLGSSQRILDKTFWARARAEPSACFERLAKLAVERPDVFAFDSGTRIALLAEVSQTSVVRFAVFNGFRGIQEMRIAFKEALKSSPQAHTIEKTPMMALIAEVGRR